MFGSSMFQEALNRWVDDRVADGTFKQLTPNDAEPVDYKDPARPDYPHREVPKDPKLP